MPVPPVSSTSPLARVRSSSSRARASSVSMSWNLRDELPQLRTRIFMQAILSEPRIPPTTSPTAPPTALSSFHGKRRYPDSVGPSSQRRALPAHGAEASRDRSGVPAARPRARRAGRGRALARRGVDQARPALRRPGPARDLPRRHGGPGDGPRDAARRQHRPAPLWRAALRARTRDRRRALSSGGGAAQGGALARRAGRGHPRRPQRSPGAAPQSRGKSRRAVSLGSRRSRSALRRGGLRGAGQPHRDADGRAAAAQASASHRVVAGARPLGAVDPARPPPGFRSAAPVPPAGRQRGAQLSPAPSPPSVLSIRDPVHGFIRADPLETALINSRPVQRLRFIHQLGFTFLVFPGAEHTRFGHVLGAMHLAGRVYDALCSKIGSKSAAQGEHLLSAGAHSPERRVARAAALLHDLGHAPFSHSAEDLFEGGIDHEEMTRRLLGTEEVEEIFRAHGEGIGTADVARLLAGGGSPTERLLSKIVSGELDVDKMDYLLRDSLFCGVRYGTYDLERLLDTILPTKDPETGEWGIGVEEGGVHALEALVMARYYMFTQVYFNVTGKAMELHLNEWLEEQEWRWAAAPEAFLGQDDVSVWTA